MTDITETNDRSPADSELLAIKDLRIEYAVRGIKRYGTIAANLEVKRGAVFGLVGESGSGKSTVARAIVGVLPQNARVVQGDIFFERSSVLGHNADKSDNLRGKTIGYVPQTPWSALQPILSIRNQFEAIRRRHHKSVAKRPWIHHSVDWLARVGLREPGRVLDLYPHQLSGGMAQRVVIALTMSLEPRLIVADEATTALDVTVQKQILELLRDLVVQEEVTLLLVTHDLGVVSNYCSDIGVMYAGSVVETGGTEDVLKEPQHWYTKALLGSRPHSGADWLTEIPGGPPTLMEIPTGCAFAPRCPAARNACTQSVPQLVASVSGNKRACFFPVSEFPLIEGDDRGSHT